MTFPPSNDQTQQTKQSVSIQQTKANELRRSINVLKQYISVNHPVKDDKKLNNLMETFLMSIVKEDSETLKPVFKAELYGFLQWLLMEEPLSKEEILDYLKIMQSFLRNHYDRDFKNIDYYFDKDVFQKSFHHKKMLETRQKHVFLKQILRSMFKGIQNDKWDLQQQQKKVLTGSKDMAYAIAAASSMEDRMLSTLRSRLQKLRDAINMMRDLQIATELDETFRLLTLLQKYRSVMGKAKKLWDNTILWIATNPRMAWEYKQKVLKMIQNKARQYSPMQTLFPAKSFPGTLKSKWEHAAQKVIKKQRQKDVFLRQFLKHVLVQYGTQVNADDVIANNVKLVSILTSTAKSQKVDTPTRSSAQLPPEVQANQEKSSRSTSVVATAQEQDVAVPPPPAASTIVKGPLNLLSLKQELAAKKKTLKAVSTQAQSQTQQQLNKKNLASTISKTRGFIKNIQQKIDILSNPTRHQQAKSIVPPQSDPARLLIKFRKDLVEHKRYLQTLQGTVPGSPVPEFKSLMSELSEGVKLRTGASVPQQTQEQKNKKDLRNRIANTKIFINDVRNKIQILSSPSRKNEVIAMYPDPIMRQRALIRNKKLLQQNEGYLKTLQKVVPGEKVPELKSIKSQIGKGIALKKVQRPPSAAGSIRQAQQPPAAAAAASNSIVQPIVAAGSVVRPPISPKLPVSLLQSINKGTNALKKLDAVPQKFEKDKKASLLQSIKGSKKNLRHVQQPAAAAKVPAPAAGDPLSQAFKKITNLRKYTAGQQEEEDDQDAQDWK